MVSPTRLLLCILVPAALASSRPDYAAGQAADSLRAAWTLPVPQGLLAYSPPAVRASPAMSSGSPTAFGAAGGDLFAAVGYQARTRYLEGADGGLVVGFGLGDSRRTVGLEVAITSASTLNTGPFRRTYVSFKTHRTFGTWGVAVGYEHAVIIDLTDPEESSPPDGGRNVFGVISNAWRLADRAPFRSLAASIGIGGGRFRSEDQVRAREGIVGVFASVGLQVAPAVSMIADWTGQDLTLGASFVPFVSLPLTITPAFADVTGSAGDGARFILGVGSGFRLEDLPWRDE